VKDKKKTSGPATSRIKVKVVQLAHGAGLPLPEYQTDGAAGLDLLAAVDEASPITLKPMHRAAIPTGLTLELPHGTEAQVRPRSGLALKQGLTVLNAPGTVDSDYRGEVQVILINLGQQDVTIRRGERIAQMILSTVVQAKLKLRLSLTQTARGTGGFGSTGMSAIADENDKPKNRKKKKIVPQKAVSEKRRSKAQAARTSRRAS
jgi:dUTP pyrophosphatase